MTNEEAIRIIRNEYKCVDRDCDIENNCGECDLMIPTKEPILEAYKMAISALEMMEKLEQATVVLRGNPDLPQTVDKRLTLNCQKVDRQGEWIPHQEDKWIYAKCSECGTVQDAESNYCPSCGVKMKKEPE